MTTTEIESIINSRGTVLLADNEYTRSVNLAGMRVRAMGWNFYGYTEMVKIGFLNPDGSYSGDHMKLPLTNIASES
jgi:hypothetical protein